MRIFIHLLNHNTIMYLMGHHRLSHFQQKMIWLWSKLCERFQSFIIDKVL